MTEIRHRLRPGVEWVILFRSLTVSIYIYVDGESHYARSAKCWRDLHGPDRTLADVVDIQGPFDGYGQGRATKTTRRFTHDEAGRLFWDAAILMRTRVIPELSHERVIKRAVYATSLVGSDEMLHNLRTLIRSAGLDPLVVLEKKDLAKRRENELDQNGIIEKPKGVDIALTAMLLEDAFNNNFDHAYLFTSDVDFLPAIEAVRRKGKRVYVCGFRSGMGERSRLDDVPDAFIDLCEMMKWYACKSSTA
jgi:uncharacterized LabA/DUF88 family protein